MRRRRIPFRRPVTRTEWFATWLALAVAYAGVFWIGWFFIMILNKVLHRF